MPAEMVEHIYDFPGADDSEGLLAIIIRGGYDKPGITFFTEPDQPQQVAFMKHPAGKVIEPHVHCACPRLVSCTQEVLVLKRGVMEVLLYTSARKFVGLRTLIGGDAIVLVAGGHGFRVLEEVEFIESKTGPYMGDRDKTRWIPEGDSYGQPQ